MLFGITYSIHLIIACRRHTHSLTHTKSWVKIITAKAVLQSVSFFAVVIVVMIVTAERFHFIDTPLRYRYHVFVYDAKLNFFFSVSFKNFTESVSLSSSCCKLMHERSSEKRNQNETKMCAKNFCACELKRRKKKKRRKKPAAMECFELHSHVTEYTGTQV